MEAGAKGYDALCPAIWMPDSEREHSEPSFREPLKVAPDNGRSAGPGLTRHPVWAAARPGQSQVKRQNVSGE
jgi:hypothetical protein